MTATDGMLGKLVEGGPGVWWNEDPAVLELVRVARRAARVFQHVALPDEAMILETALAGVPVAGEAE